MHSNAQDSTELVWIPMSAGLSANQRSKPAATIVGSVDARPTGSGRGHERQTGRHVCVVWPLAGGALAEPSAPHLGQNAWTMGRSTELGRHAEGVADCLGEQHPCRSVDRGSREAIRRANRRHDENVTRPTDRHPASGGSSAKHLVKLTSRVGAWPTNPRTSRRSP